MIALDVETTGWYPVSRYSLLSIGALDYDNHKNSFYGECRAWLGAAIDKKALDINGFTEAEITRIDRKSLQELMKEFLAWTKNIEDVTLIGHNPFLELHYLNISLERSKIPGIFGRRMVDLHTIAYTSFRLSNLKIPLENKSSGLSLDEILKYTGLPAEPIPHRALVGAKMEAEAFSRLVYKKNLLKEFKKYKLPDFLKE